jgi:hypothetical protein
MLMFNVWRIGRLPINLPPPPRLSIHYRLTQYKIIFAKRLQILVITFAQFSGVMGAAITPTAVPMNPPMALHNGDLTVMNPIYL